MLVVVTSTVKLVRVIVIGRANAAVVASLWDADKAYLRYLERPHSYHIYTGWISNENAIS